MDGWPEALAEVRELWRHKARGRGALTLMVGLAAHFQCMQVPPLREHSVEGQWPSGQQRTRVALRPGG
jgi:hypothetical protein